METGHVTISYERLAEKFWETEKGKLAQEGMRLDHTAMLPSFLADHVRFNSDEEVAAFYAAGGAYEQIKERVVQLWPKER